MKPSTLFITLILIGYAINAFGVGDFLPILLLPYFLLKAFKIKVSKGFAAALILLFLFNMVYYFLTGYYGFYSITSVMGKSIFPIMFLFLGYELIGKENSHKKAIRYLTIFISSISLYGILSVLKTERVYGTIEKATSILGGRLTIDFWSSNLISATSINSFLSLGLAVIPVILLSVKRGEIGRRTKLLYTLLFLLSFYSSVQVISRTGVLIIALSLILSFFLIKRPMSRKILTVFSVSLIAFFSWIVWVFDILELKTNIMNNYLYRRITTTNLDSESRFTAWGNTLKDMFSNPAGGRSSDIGAGYAHNIWLDTLYDAGIIPFVLLLLFTTVCFVAITKFLLKKQPILMKAIAVSMATGFFTIFMLEPVLQGLGVYFTIFCFYVGVIFKLNHLDYMEKVELKTSQ